MLDNRSPTKLILINGSPGSGKTTLSRKIGQHFGFPVISRDALKEQLFATIPPDDRASSRQLGVVSWSLLYTVLDTLIEHVAGVIVDSNFSHGIAEPEVLPRLAKCSSAVVHCFAPWHVIEHRIKARQDDPSRHQGHFDQDALAEVKQAYHNGRYDALDLPVPTILISTIDGYAPEISDIMSTLRDLLDTRAA